jgi:hypothetical protein
MTAVKHCASNDKPASLTRESARWLKRQLSKKIVPEATEMVALCVMDFLLSCIDALSTPTGSNIAQFTGRTSGRVEALQFGITDDIRAVDAAFGNAALGHSLIRDDIDVASDSHLGVIIVPFSTAKQVKSLCGRFATWTTWSERLMGGASRAVGLFQRFSSRFGRARSGCRDGSRRKNPNRPMRMLGSA